MSASSDAKHQLSSWGKSPTEARRPVKQQRSKETRVKSLEPLGHKPNNVAGCHSERELLGSRRRARRKDPIEKRKQLQALEDETRIYGKGLPAATKLKLKRITAHKGSAGSLDPLMKQIERQATSLAQALEVRLVIQLYTPDIQP